jgi:membrane protease YdiL (CAAX protease family)
MESTGIQPVLEPISEQPSQPRYTARMRWIDLGLVLLISLAPSIAVSTYALFVPSYLAGDVSYNGLTIASLVLRYSTALLAVVYVLSRQGRRVKEIGLGLRWSDPLKAVGLAILAFFGTSIMYVMTRNVTQALWHAPPDMRHIVYPGWHSRSFGALAHSIGAPIFEEVLVRGYLMTEMIELGTPAWLAVVVSVFVQASYHTYYGLGGAIMLSGVFIVFAVYFAKSRNLMPVILAHLLWDVFLYFRS